MPTNQPDFTATWATGGGADIAKPSSTRYNSGITSGQKADFNSDLNYLVNRVTGWSDFLWRTLAPDTAARNFSPGTETDPFTATNPLAAVHVRYDELAGRWYAIASDLGTNGNIRCFDSDDGVTWSDAKLISSVNTDAGHFAPIWTDGTQCAAIVTDEAGGNPSFWLSTDLTVANLVEHSTSIAGVLDIPIDMLFDQDSGRWFVLGENSAGTASYIYSSTDGTTWTQEASSASLFSSFATDQQGNALAVFSNSSSCRYVTGGMTGTWGTGGTSTSSTRRVKYLPNVGLYVAVSTGDSLLVVHDSDLGSALFDTDYNATSLMFSSDVNLFIGQASTRSNDRELCSFVSAAARDRFTVRTLGYIGWDEAQQWVNNMTFEGGAGKLPYSYQFGSSSDDRHGNFTYGPKA